jgi:hypothetical protein
MVTVSFYSRAGKKGLSKEEQLVAAKQNRCEPGPTMGILRSVYKRRISKNAPVVMSDRITAPKSINNHPGARVYWPCTT